MSQFSDKMDELMQIKQSLYFDYEEKDEETALGFDAYIKDEFAPISDSKKNKIVNFLNSGWLTFLLLVGIFLPLVLSFYDIEVNFIIQIVFQIMFFITMVFRFYLKEDTKFFRKLKKYRKYRINSGLHFGFIVMALLTIVVGILMIYNESSRLNDSRLTILIISAVVCLIFICLSQLFWDNAGNAFVEFKETVKYDFYKQKYEKIIVNTPKDLENKTLNESERESLQNSRNKKILEWQKWQNSTKTNLDRINSLHSSMWISFLVCILTTALSLSFLFIKTVNVGDNSFSIYEIIFRGEPTINKKELREIFDSLKMIVQFVTPLLIILILYVAIFFEYAVAKTSRNISKTSKSFKSLMAYRVFENKGIVDYTIRTGALKRALKGIINFSALLVVLLLYGSTFLMQQEIANSDALTQYVFKELMSFEWILIYIGIFSSVCMFVSNIVYNKYCDKLASIYSWISADYQAYSPLIFKGRSKSI